MATSVVDICNSALIHLGAGLISSLGDNSDEARACNQFYNGARDHVLADGIFNFATTQQTLSKLVSVPLFEFAFAYQLPTDPYCLRALHLENPELDTLWKVKGRELHTDRDDVLLEYVFRNTDVSQYSPASTIALEFFMAHRLGYVITGSRAVAADMKALYDDAIADAQDIDAQEGQADDFNADEPINVRR